jgi:hypothetical protein
MDSQLISPKSKILLKQNVFEKSLLHSKMRAGVALNRIIPVGNYQMRVVRENVSCKNDKELNLVIESLKLGEKYFEWVWKESGSYDVLVLVDNNWNIKNIDVIERKNMKKLVRENDERIALNREQNASSVNIGSVSIKEPDPDSGVTLIEGDICDSEQSTIQCIPENYDFTEIRNIILDFSLDQEFRISVIEKFFDMFDPEDRSDDLLEFTCIISRIYQMSGTKVIEDYLIAVSSNGKINRTLCLMIAMILVDYEEISMSKDKGEIEWIAQRNSIRRERSFTSLFDACSNMNKVPTPYKVEVVVKLLEYERLIHSSTCMFTDIINDKEIDVDYRYKVLLKLDKNKYGSVVEKSLIIFSKSNHNLVYYRILSSQYLLELYKNETITLTNKNHSISIVESDLLSFAKDETLDYNRRADALDVLLQFSTGDTLEESRVLMRMLGGVFGNDRATVYDNQQNVHTSKIESSALDIIKDLVSTVSEEKCQGDSLLNITGITGKLFKFRGWNKVFDASKEKCEMCGEVLVAPAQTVLLDTLEVSCVDNYCSSLCKSRKEEKNKIIFALERVKMDRKLYTEFSLTLERVFILVWNYITTRIPSKETKMELKNRLCEELVEMSDTCSSGFIARFPNILCGYTSYQILISWKDQILGNVTGRLNHKARTVIKGDESLFNNKVDIDEISKLFCKYYGDEEPEVLHTNTETLSVSIKDEDVESPTRSENILQTFYERVLEEVSYMSYDKRQSFLYFFRRTIGGIKEEMYQEFKEYMDDASFDLYFTQAILAYTDGI